MHCVTCGVLFAAEQREFEASLKKRKRDFGETLERYESEVDKYAQRSELSKRDEMAAQVTDLSQKLKEVSLVLQNKPQVHMQHSLSHIHLPLVLCWAFSLPNSLHWSTHLLQTYLHAQSLLESVESGHVGCG